MVKLAISNIAWSRANDESIFSLLRQYDVTGIEVAPTKICDNWNEISVTKLKDYRQKLETDGFTIPALQAVLYNKPDCLLFGTLQQQQALVDHLATVADIAHILGANVIVLGAPQQRSHNHLSTTQALEIAVPILHKIANDCLAKNVCLCIEPNPPQYQCNFITNANEALELVTKVNSAGFALHLDSGALFLANDEQNIFPTAKFQLKHFHISEPGLNEFTQPLVPHESYARQLKTINYKHWLSLEMRAAAEQDDEYARIKLALEFIRRIYVAN